MYKTMNDTINENNYNSNNLNICPICHENIDCMIPESYIIFNCCNQIAHIDCIISWANSNFAKNNKDNISSCIMCQSENEILHDITRNLNDISINIIHNNTNTPDLQNINSENIESDENNSTEPDQNNSTEPDQNNKWLPPCIKICTFIIGIGIIIILIIII